LIQTKDNKGPVVSDTDILQEVQMIELSKLIGNKYDHIVRRLTEDEFLGLKDSIAAEGIHIPIAINLEYMILDGHHRVKAARELYIEKIPVLFKSFESELYEENFIIDRPATSSA
jgi:ParB-like chromosome segregation protein Spo0J